MTAVTKRAGDQKVIVIEHFMVTCDPRVDELMRVGGIDHIYALVSKWRTPTIPQSIATVVTLTATLKGQAVVKT